MTRRRLTTLSYSYSDSYGYESDPVGNGSPAGAMGQLRQQNPFPDLKAYTVLLGCTYSF